ncbi:MAG: DUF885 domain-containing protein [Gemmatimonadaceae bacterium]|nr:DUF885 domain-containing protein [Gemmatimonadaceae bacterium]
MARQRLQEATQTYWRLVLPSRPDLAATVGRPIEALVSPVLSADDHSASRTAIRVIDQLETVDARALSPTDYATMQTLRWEVESAAEAQAFASIDFSLLSPARSALRVPLEVSTRLEFASTMDLDRYLFLLDGIAFWLLDARNALELRARDQAFASRDAVRAFRGLLDSLRAVVRRGELRIGDDRLTAIAPAHVAQFRGEEARAITEQIGPAIDSLTAYLGQYEARSMLRPGLWQYPGGKEFYRHLLRRHLGVEIEPEDAHRVGLAEARRIDSLLIAVRRRLGWNGSVAAFHDSLRQLPAFAPVSAESAMAHLHATLAAMRDSIVTRIDAPLSQTPDIRMATPLEQLLDPEGLVRPPRNVGESARVTITPAWLSVESQLEGPSRVMRWVWPGAALAMTQSYAHDTLNPMLLLHPSRATQEGWAEYAASLAGELGAYVNPLDAYGRLMHEGWNAALLIADTGIHYLGWTPEQALAVLRPFSFADDSTLRARLVDQVILAPGRAGASAIGAREIAAQRAWIRGTLGPAFDEPSWHAAVLALGPVPLPVMASYLEWWAYDVGRRQAELKAVRTP